MFFKVGTRIYGNGYAVPVDESGNEIQLSLPESDLVVHYDIGDANGYDAGAGIIRNLSPNPDAAFADMQVLGGTVELTPNGFLAFDGVSTYAEAIGTHSDLWRLMNFDGNKSFTIYGSFYSSARASAGISFGKFGGYDLFQRQSYDSPNAKFGVHDIWDDGRTDDFVNYFPTETDFGPQTNEWFQAGLRVTYIDDGSDQSKVEFLFNGKSLETWLNEYTGPTGENGEPLEAGPARFAFFEGTHKIGDLQWNIEPTSWKIEPFRMGRHSINDYYAPNVVSYFAQYSRSITDTELLELHDYHQVRFQ